MECFDIQKLLCDGSLKWIDLSHELCENCPTWEGDCGFSLKEHLIDCENGSFSIQELWMRNGTGTHMDAPAHMISHGATISELPLPQLIAPLFVIDVSKEANENYTVPLEKITQFEQEHHNDWKDSFVIFYTGWSQLWHDKEKYRNNLKFPSVNPQVAEYLVNSGIVGIGIDTLSPDRLDSNFGVHKCVLDRGKYLIENITQAEQLPSTSAIIFAFPLKILKGTEAPLRLIAAVPQRRFPKI